jgi:hypothetical protein
MAINGIEGILHVYLDNDPIRMLLSPRLRSVNDSVTSTRHTNAELDWLQVRQRLRDALLQQNLGRQLDYFLTTHNWSIHRSLYTINNFKKKKKKKIE